MEIATTVLIYAIGLIALIHLAGSIYRGNRGNPQGAIHSALLSIIFLLIYIINVL